MRFLSLAAVAALVALPFIAFKSDGSESDESDRSVEKKRHRKSHSVSHKSASHVTTDHSEIREWVESRGGYPAVVSRTHKKKGSGLLRVDYPGYTGKQSLEPISWKEFFKVFEKRHLALLYQNRTKNGKKSRFSKLVARH